MMTTTKIEDVINALHTVMTAFDPDGRGRPRYTRSADAFSFDRQPRTDLTAYFLGPPSTRTLFAYAQGANLAADLEIWLSREAREGAERQMGLLAGDLARLRRALVRSDLGGDVNLHEDGIRMTVAPRPADGVSVVGRISFTVDYDVDDADGAAA